MPLDPVQWADAVLDHVREATTPLLKEIRAQQTRIDDLERRIAAVQIIKGEMGPVGPAGPQGPVGPAGDVGPCGERGPSGEIGPRGEAGAVGPMGEKGAQGDAGIAGRDGLSVVKTIQNAEGELLLTLSNGETLNAGVVRGRDGINGKDGAPGAKGDVGEKGADGLRGEKGEPGLSIKGDTGERGADGKDGLSIKGDTGDRGEQGPVGDRGADGDSAFAIAKRFGFAGSESDWLASLRGKDGIDGKDGLSIKGDPGVDGKDGANGADGKDGLSIKGDPGIDGKDGADGISVRGALIDASGELVQTLSDGTVQRIGVVRGEKGADGRDAAEIRPIDIDSTRNYDGGTWGCWKGGLFLSERSTEPLTSGGTLSQCGWRTIVDGSDLSADLADDARTFTLRNTRSSGAVLEQEFRLPTIVYRGVWSASTVYQKGDAVSRDGSLWIAREDGPSSSLPPGAGNRDWVLSVKRGSDGK